MIELNKKYIPLYDSDCRYFIITGGRGSGKSYEVTTWGALLSFEQGHKILYTRYTMTSAGQSIIPEFEEKIDLLKRPQSFYINKSEILNIESGSSIIFSGIKTSSGNQTAKLKSLQGITTWVLDEAEELDDEDIFDKIDQSVRSKTGQNRIVLILNPTTKEHWIYKRFFESRGVPTGWNGIKGDTAYIHTTYLENIENLDESFIRIADDMKERRPEKYKHQMLGGWLNKAEGVVFSNWTVGEYPKEVDSVFGMDFGFSVDPTTLLATYIDKSQKKIYLKELFYRPGLTTTDIYRLTTEHAKGSLIVADCAEPRLITELKGRGLNITEAEKGQGSVTGGIGLMQDFDLIVDPDSTNLIKELNNYAWLDKKKSTPQDSYNHAIDAIRYAVTYQLANPNKGKYNVY